MDRLGQEISEACSRMDRSSAARRRPKQKCLRKPAERFRRLGVLYSLCQEGALKRGEVDDSEFLQRICEGYVHCYRTFRLRTRNNWSDLTHREVGFFCQLGEMLGFFALQEQNKDDLHWYEDFRATKRALHLERETEDSRACTEAVRKLIDDRQAKYLVAVLGWVVEDRIDQIKEQVRSSQLGNRCLAVMAFVGPNKDSATGFRALVFSGSAVLGREGKAEWDNGNYWYLHFTGPWEAEPM